MNKKILISLATIGAVAAIAIGGTIAYFSDTETSTGNTFTAGSLDLTVDSQCKYNGQVIPDCNWVNWRNLNSEKFFNFTDVKPGDSGEDTISLHVTNDSWACMKLTNIVSAENSCTEPESQVETRCDPNGAGELQGALAMQVWRDTDCDNKLDANETVITPAQSGSDVIYPIADSQNGTQLLASTDKTCVGVAWNVPSTVGNEIQSDSLSENVVFYAEQWRNNPNFRCVPITTISYNDWPAYQQPAYGTKVWEAEGRIGDLPPTSGATTWEVGVGKNTQGDTQDNNQTDADFDWPNNTNVPFSLTYDGRSGVATFAVTGAATQTYNVGTDIGSKLWVAVKAASTYTATAQNLNINGTPLSDVVTSTGGTASSIQIVGVDPSAGFTLTGDIVFAYTDSPSQSALDFKVEISQ